MSCIEFAWKLVPDPNHHTDHQKCRSKLPEGFDSILDYSCSFCVVGFHNAGESNALCALIHLSELIQLITSPS